MTSIKAILGLAPGSCLGRSVRSRELCPGAPLHPGWGALHVTKECSQYFGHAGEIYGSPRRTSSEIEAWHERRLRLHGRGGRGDC